jgi:hypothetical protein
MQNSYLHKCRRPNPDGLWSFLPAPKANSRATSPRSDGQWDFAISSCEPWPLILLLEDFFRSKASSIRTFSWVLLPGITKELSLLSLSTLTPSETSRTLSSRSTLNNSRSVEPSRLCALPATVVPSSLCSDLQLRLQFQPALLLHGSTNPNQLLGERE